MSSIRFEQNINYLKLLQLLNKIIPQFIIDSSDKSIKELIKGYWIGDGHYTKRKERKKGKK